MRDLTAGLLMEKIDNGQLNSECLTYSGQKIDAEIAYTNSACLRIILFIAKYNPPADLLAYSCGMTEHESARRSRAIHRNIS